MGYYADLIKEKRNAKYSYNLVKKSENKWVIQTKYGGKTVDEQEFYGTEEDAKRKGENNVRYFESRNEKEEKENGPDEDNKILEKIAPVLVRKYKRAQTPVASPAEVTEMLETRAKFPPTLAQQAVQMWYDHV